MRTRFDNTTKHAHKILPSYCICWVCFTGDGVAADMIDDGKHDSSQNYERYCNRAICCVTCQL